MKKNKILITGGSGFIGTNLVKSLLNSKYNKILNVDNLTYASNTEYTLLKSSNYKFIKLNILNKKKLYETLNDFKPNIIFHLAAQTHVDRSISGPNLFINTNFIGTFNLIDSYKKIIEANKSIFTNKCKFIHLSTDEVYGDHVSLMIPKSKESSILNPSSPYSASKASAEHLVMAWIRTFNFPGIICRISNNYGPFQHTEKFIPKVIKNCLQRKKIPIYGSGLQSRNWIHVSDTVEALIKVMKHSKIDKTYNISSDTVLKNIDIVKIIYKLINKKIYKNKIIKLENLISHIDDRLGHDFLYYIDSSKIKKELLWKPKIELKKGLESTINWYLMNYKKY